jgi:hypothetical protein
MKFSSTVLIQAPKEFVWSFLTEPELIKLWEEDYVYSTFLPEIKNQKPATRNYYVDQETLKKTHTIQKLVDFSTNEFISDRTSSKNFDSTSKTFLESFGQQTKLTTFINLKFENVFISLFRFFLVPQIQAEQAKKYHKLKQIAEKTYIYSKNSLPNLS